MKPTENIEEFVKLEKPHVTTGGAMDKQTLNDSFAAMDETIRAGKPNAAGIILYSRSTKIVAAAVWIIGLTVGVLIGWDTWQSRGIESVERLQVAQVEPTDIYNLDYLSDAPKGSLADAYLTLVSATNGKEH
jgi:hypothetical protein